MRVKFTRISASDIKSDHPLRTEGCEGVLADAICLGEPLIILAKPIDPKANVRVIRTSPVVKLVKLAPNLSEVLTETGSVYHIEYL